MELAVRQKYRINVLATRTGDQLEFLPGPMHRFRREETMFILGANRDVQKFLNL